MELVWQNGSISALIIYTIKIYIIQFNRLTHMYNFIWPQCTQLGLSKGQIAQSLY